MSKRFMIGAGLVLLVGVLGLSIYMWYATRGVITAPLTARELYGDKIPQPPGPIVMPPLDPKQPVRLAFGWLGLPDENENREVADLMVTQLSSARNVQLVDRQSLDKTLREAQLSLSGLVRAATAIQVGRLLKADWFLLGTSVKVNDGNAVVVRVVDVRTGIMRNVAVFPKESSLPRLADKLAGFVRQSREAASGSKPRQYLAVGVFKDKSVNTRQADFPAQLRSYLTAAYAGSDITVLEREYVEVLLREVRLDLAGLTDESVADPAPPFQSGFWMVNGEYQSYETTNREVEINLSVVRMFGSFTNVYLRGEPGEIISKQVKVALDRLINDPGPMPVPRKITEARTQMGAGMALIGIWDIRMLGSDYGFYGDDAEYSRRRRNLEEAIRAFQTVLLLEPTNRAAKIYLAACLRDSTVRRYDESRNQYREVIDEAVEDKWAPLARQAIEWSFSMSGTREKARWYEAAARGATNSAARKFYDEEGGKSARDVAIAAGEGANVAELAKGRLFETLRTIDTGTMSVADMGMGDFVNSFGPDRAIGIKRLVELLPQMKTVATNSIPELLAALVILQNDTNSPLIAEYAQSLDWCADHPEKILHRSAGSVWSGGYYFIREWSQTNHLPAFTARILEAKLRAARNDPNSMMLAGGTGDETRIALAFTYIAMERWKDALDILETYSNRPVFLGNSGPWGNAFTTVRTSYTANFCRRKMGMPEYHNPAEFQMEDTGVCFCPSSGIVHAVRKYSNPTGAFAVGDAGLWLAHEGRLISTDFNLKTNLVVSLPIDPSDGITCLIVGLSNVWIGTHGDGVVVFDKVGQGCRKLTDKDGLMMNHVGCLCTADGALWIGYGEQSSGGLGRLDLPSGRITSFVSSLNSQSNRGTGPVRSPVGSLGLGVDGDVWMASGISISCYHGGSGSWDQEAGYQHTTCMAANGEQLFAGEGPGGSGKTSGGLGINIRDLKTGKWRSFPAVDYLCGGQVSVVSVAGPNIWVGGLGYVALVDPNEMKVLKFAYVRARGVDSIEVGGGYVWAQIDWRLYRAAIH